MAQVKKGMFILLKGAPHQIVDFTHHAMGRGRGILNLKLRNLTNGSVVTHTMKSAGDLEVIEVTQKNFQYLYSDEKFAYFMDSETFEQVSLPLPNIEDSLPFLKEGEKYALYLYQGTPIAVNLPKVIVLEVTETAPGVKGDSSGNPTKEAVLETGLRVRVPLFINKGDKIKVNVERKEYVERVQ